VTSNSFRRAGYLAMTSAILSIPFLVLTYQLSQREDVAAYALQAAMQLVGLFLFIYLAALLKKYLNQYHSFHDVDNYIDFLITTNLIFSLATVAGLFIPAYEIAIERFCFMLIVVFGIVQVLFGFKLLRAPDILKGMLKPYSICTLITGALIATVVFLPVAVLTGAIADVMLGTLFFQATGQTTHDSVE
jgi:hypothetical protein